MEVVFADDICRILPAMQETQVLSLGWEDPLDEEMATHSSILAWRLPLAEEHGGVAKSRTRLKRLRTHTKNMIELDT